MKATSTLPLIAALGLLAVPGTALAAPAKIGGVSAVSPAGATSVKIANPNRYVLTGSVQLITGQQLLASRRVKVKGHRSATARMTLSKGALSALRAGGMRATVAARLGHGKHRAKVVRKSLELTVGSAGGQGGGDGGGGGGGVTSNRWLATTSTGATFPFTLDGSTINVTSTPLMFVSCFQTGGSSQTSSSSEMFDLAGPWTLGNQDGTQTKSVPRVNQLVGSGARTVTYKLRSTRAGNQISGSLTQSFADSKYNPFDNSITFINCAGTLNFTAAPAA